MRSMRRRYQQVDDMAILVQWLEEATVGRLATIDENGYPVIKPVNFVYAEGKIYFHSAPEGEKLDDIRRNDRVGFEIDRLFAITPPPQRACQTHCFYQSVILRGRARILDDLVEPDVKEQTLRLLVGKYAPSFADRPLDTADPVAIVEIAVDHISGKEDFGQKWSPARKLAVACLLLDRDGDAAAETIARLGLTMAEVLGADSNQAT